MRVRTASHPTGARRIAIPCVLAVLAVLLVVAAAQPAAALTPGEVAWARIVPGVATVDIDRVIDVAPGPGGTVYALGVYDEPSASGWTWVARYTAAGRAMWVKKYGEAQGVDANCWAMAVDRAGNLVVAGNQRPVGSTDSDMLVLKYAPTGRRVWARTYAGPGGGPDGATGVATDAAGNVYAGGYAAQTGAYSAFAVVRWDASGRRGWVATVASLTPGPLDGAVALAIDARGDTYVTGHVKDSATTTACLTAKVSAAGAVLWQQLFKPEIGDFYGVRIVVRGSAVYVAGRAYTFTYSTSFLVKYAGTGAMSWWSWSSLVQDLFAPLALAVGADGSAWLATSALDMSGNPHAVLRRFDGAGNVWWTQGDTDAALRSRYYDVVVDGAGTAWVVGSQTEPTSMISDVFVASYSSAAEERWSMTWRRAVDQDSEAQCACLLGKGALLIGGWSDSDLTARDALLLSVRR
jgi:hypothetical protein